MNMADTTNNRDIIELKEKMRLLHCNSTLIDKSERLLSQKNFLIKKLTADAVHERTQELEKKIAKSKKETEHLVKEIEEKKKELEHLEGQINNNHEAYVSEAKLYYTISGITWDLDKAPNEVFGYTTKDRLKTFALDPSTHGQFFVSNHLWNLLAEEA